MQAKEPTTYYDDDESRWTVNEKIHTGLDAIVGLYCWESMPWNYGREINHSDLHGSRRPLNMKLRHIYSFRKGRLFVHMVSISPWGKVGHEEIDRMKRPFHPKLEQKHKICRVRFVFNSELGWVASGSRWNILQPRVVYRRSWDGSWGIWGTTIVPTAPQWGSY